MKNPEAVQLIMRYYETWAGINAAYERFAARLGVTANLLYLLDLLCCVQQPLVFMCLTLRDRVVGAFRSAGTAVHALIGVDDVLAVAFADAADRTDVCTGAAHHTVVIDNMCHYKAPPFLR